MYQDIEMLAQIYFNDPSSANQRALVMGCGPLVRSIITRLKVPPRFLTSYDDMQGVGLLGLVEAMERFDPSRGTLFTSYAYLRIRGAIIDYLRMLDVIPRERREAIARMHEATEALSQQQGHPPSDQEVADFLGVSLEDYHTLVRDAQLRDLPGTFPSATPEFELDALMDTDANVDFRRIDWASDRSFISRVIHTLPERKRQILKYYYEDGLTLKEIGTRLDVSESRISQIHGQIIAELRSSLAQARRAA